MAHANGTFEVRLEPQPLSEQGEHAKLGRLSVAKQFYGDLEATSTGEMLAAMTSVEDSAGYVAMERVVGSLHGRSGSFVLQHNGILDRGAQELTIIIVPDSGTDGLTAIRGQMTILIEDGQHGYQLEYVLP